jgi:hypothetical protein
MIETRDELVRIKGQLLKAVIQAIARPLLWDVSAVA